MPTVTHESLYACRYLGVVPALLPLPFRGAFQPDCPIVANAQVPTVTRESLYTCGYLGVVPVLRDSLVQQQYPEVHMTFLFLFSVLFFLSFYAGFQFTLLVGVCISPPLEPLHEP